MSTATTPPRTPLAPPAPLDLLEPRLRALCDAYLGAGKVPGASVAIVAADQRYHHAHGVKVAGQDAPVTAATGFNIGSCSKAFASATVAALVGEGLAQWDDPLTRWVPEFALHDPTLTAQVSLRDVCGNRLGLPRVGFTEYGFVPSVPVERILGGLRHTAPIHPLRDRFTYVNAGHTAAALAAGRIGGLGFLPTLRQRLLEPLGMTGTSGGAAAESELADRAGWHIRDGEQVLAVDQVFADHYLGSGGMVVSGQDALQWLRLHLNGGLVDGHQVLPRAALLETHRPTAVATPGKDVLSLFYPGARMGAYALGWAVADLEGHPVVCHSGSDYGVTAMTLLLPRAGIGIAVYANALTNVVVPLAHALAATLLALPPRDWLAYYKAAAAAITPPPAAAPQPGVQAALPLADYAGVYSHPADGPLQIQPAGETLAGHFPDGNLMDCDLKPLGGHRFALQFNQVPNSLTLLGFQLEFQLVGGAVAAAVLHDAAGATRVFARAAPAAA
jgi:CubicO group peptidase (beta-lactamase class C family)